MPNLAVAHQGSLMQYFLVYHFICLCINSSVNVCYTLQHARGDVLAELLLSRLVD